MEIKISNFEIIEDAELEFIPGLNVIVGQSNNGKSSIFRAIQSALFNELGDDFINNSKNRARVVIKDGDNKIEWRKRRHKSPTTIYNINGEEYGKVGRTQFDKVADISNITEVKLTSNSKERLNFWNQMEYPFLLDKTGSQLFEFLSLSSENENLAEVVKEMEGDKKEIKKKINKVEGGIDSLHEIIRDEEEYLKTKQGFEDLYSDIIDIESVVSEYEDLKEKYNNSLEKKNKYNNVKQVYKEIEVFMRGFVPDYEKVGKDIDTFLNLKSSLQDIYDKKKKVDKVEGEIEKISEKISSINLSELGDSLEKYRVIKSEYDDIKIRISDISELEENKNKLSNLVTNIKNRLGNIDIESIGDYLNRLENKKEKHNKIDNYINNISSLYENKETLVCHIEDVMEDMEDVSEQLAEFDMCPFCGSELKGGVEINV